MTAALQSYLRNIVKLPLASNLHNTNSVRVSYHIFKQLLYCDQVGS